MAISADGRVLYQLSVALDAGELRLYDTASGVSLTETVPTAATPMAVAAHPTKPIVYVSCLTDQVVEFRDGSTGQLLFGSARRSSVPVGSAARFLFVPPGTDTLFVTCFDDNSVMMLDAETGEHRRTVAVGEGPYYAAMC
jgi:DNA-binding beta-propeller fold protein YncE